MNTDLVAACQQALDLTFRQRLAIKQGRWKDLHDLLDLREHVLLRTAELLSESDDPDHRSEAGSVLAHMREQNETNIRILADRKFEVSRRLGRMRQANRALSGYQGALRGGQPESGTFDRER